MQGSAILGRRYQYDQAGNLKGIEDIRNGATRYGYDRIGRILSSIQPSLAERFAFDPAHNMLPVAGDGKSSSNGQPTGSQGLVKNNRLEVFEDQRFAYDTHGNLIEKKIGKHTVIELEWDVEHQLQKATVTKAAHSPKPVKTETRYRYDAFGRRLEKKDAFGQTLFEWDGNRLLSEQRGSNHKLYVYEADSFAPLAQISLQADSKPKRPQVGVEPAPVAIKLELAEDEDWQPRKTAQAFQDQMRALQKATMAKARGRQRESEEQADFDDTLPPEDDEPKESSNVVSLKDWSVRYYHNDHLGTPRELSDEDGGIVWQATYKAWGNTLKVEAARPAAQTLSNAELQSETVRRAEAKNDPNAELQPIEQNLRFQGQYFDQETGLHYNRFRYYDPDIGRFVSQDPIGLWGGENVYAYAPNAWSWIDPLGLKKCSLRMIGHTKIFGEGQVTGPGHDQLAELITNKLAMSGKFTEIYIDLSYSTAIGQPGTSRRRPDITAVDKNGKVHAIEIPSKTDISQNKPLKQRNLDAMRCVPIAKQGTVTVLSYPYNAKSIKSDIDGLLKIIK